MRFATFLVFLPALIGSCTCSSDSVNRGDLNLISLREEWQMGAQFEQEIARQLPLVQDPILEGYVSAVGQDLAAATELADLPWTFFVVADPQINAFAVPGGRVYVNTGLIEAAESTAELAGVMAHEIAHGVARHSTERLTKVYGLNVVASLVLGEDPGLFEQIVAQIIGAGTVAKFSRDDEREADRLGVHFMHDAGFDPAGMIALFETLLEARERRPNAVERFFSTHPMTEERIDEARREAATIPETGDALTDDPRFQQMRRQAARYHQ